MFERIFEDLTSSFSAVPLGTASLRLCAAIALGAVIGFERERKEKPAGLRTHMLVAMAACLFVVAGMEISALDFGDVDDKRVDPLRLIEAVTAGVAFLAAGLIFTSGGEVRNVTTGASLWLAGAIGLACGAGQVPLAALATVITVVVLYLLGRIERATGTHPKND
ncbi:MgtC/SapB family protein [Wenxinia marina]|uniref:Protein MgtC n=1 Tax=Wenxinia marina DSM 24838 TaxID=1123501 RepID=A0A0D0P9A7_9RHOB|nr:MgtC/SapB family protein [Wenxinia marina]KIQ68141.1 putative membrane protein [Wenxinia marina DSM 24838]